MKGNKGFFLLTDMVIFMLCSILLTAAITSLMKCCEIACESEELWRAANEAQLFVAGKRNDDFCVECRTENIMGFSVKSIIVARKAQHEKIIYSLAIVEE